MQKVYMSPTPKIFDLIDRQQVRSTSNHHSTGARRREKVITEDLYEEKDPDNACRQACDSPIDDIVAERKQRRSTRPPDEQRHDSTLQKAGGRPLARHRPAFVYRRVENIGRRIIDIRSRPSGDYAAGHSIRHTGHNQNDHATTCPDHGSID